jgi:hypothetical protein
VLASDCSKLCDIISSKKMLLSFCDPGQQSVVAKLKES